VRACVRACVRDEMHYLLTEESSL